MFHIETYLYFHLLLFIQCPLWLYVILSFTFQMYLHCWYTFGLCHPFAVIQFLICCDVTGYLRIWSYNGMLNFYVIPYKLVWMYQCICGILPAIDCCIINLRWYGIIDYKIRLSRFMLHFELRHVIIFCKLFNHQLLFILSLKHDARWEGSKARHVIDI